MRRLASNASIASTLVIACAAIPNFAQVQPSLTPAQASDNPNLAPRALAIASEDFGPALVPRFANDGDPSTRWSGISGHNVGVWFELDWPQPVTLRQVVLQQYDTYVMELDLQSWDAAKGIGPRSNISAPQGRSCRWS